MSFYSLESKIENLCEQILKTDSENWDAKNRAVLQITELVLEFDGRSPGDIDGAFTPNVFRILKEPIKILISDLRSQQVRDTCTLLIHLTRIAGEKMKPFLRDSFPNILEGIKVPNKVMSGYVDECVLSMIHNTTFKSAIPTLSMEIRESKAKFVREKCLEYINEILLNWELIEKEYDPICDALRVGLEDASPKARELARAAFINVYKLHSKKAEKLRLDLPKQLQSKLMEEILKVGSKGESVSSMDSGGQDSVPTTPYTPARPRVSRISSSSAKLTHTNTNTNSNNVSQSSTFNTTSSTMKSYSVDACQSVNNLSEVDPSANPRTAGFNRRRSVVKNPFAELSSSYSSYGDMQSQSSPSKRGSLLSIDTVNESTFSSVVSSPNASPTKSSYDPTTTATSKQLSIGMKVTVSAGKELKVPGTIRFIGNTLFASGIWVGVELTAPLGKNNGSVQGTYYFECPMQYGLFLREENVHPLQDDNKGGGALSPLAVDLDAMSLSSHTSASVATAATTSGAGENKKMGSASVLKVKLSQMMELLNKQLEIVEELEREEKTSTVSRTSMKCNGLRDEVFKISCREMELIENFCYKWKEYCSDS